MPTYVHSYFSECGGNTYGVNCLEPCKCNVTNSANENQTCNHITGECACNEFWSGPLCDTDVNECLNKSECDTPNTVCRNYPGGHECTCTDGYTFDNTNNCVKGNLT